jgi:hypothetical protein
MGNDVYANMMEVSCKAGSGKAICAFPDVCMTPPMTPATPPGVPIPYPNTGLDTDTTDGSTSVKVGGQEAMLKNKSYFKKSSGDEAGSAPKKNLITSKIMGKVYFNVWSMDVMFEGENVVRNLDLTTHNHASPPGGTPTWPLVSRMAPPAADLPKKPCEEACKKKPDAERKKELRRATPDDAAVKQVNAQNPKICASCKQAHPSLAADHIVPASMIMKMPGFGCMSADDQKKVLNTPSNFVGLCTPCNSSKCAKLWHKWGGVKKTGMVHEAQTRTDAMKVTGDLIYNMKQDIRSKDCE